MSNLFPCPACNRHLRGTEVACPFCSADLPEPIPPQTSIQRSPRRRGRLALLTAGVAFIGVEACSVAVYGAPSPDAGNTPTTDGGSDASSSTDGGAQRSGAQRN
jgi:hypothetical protein